MFCWSEERRYHHCSGRTLPSSSHLTMGDNPIEIQLCSKKGMCCCYWSQVTFFRCGSLWSRCYTHNSKLLRKKQVTLGLHVSQMPFNLPMCHCLVGFSCGWFQPNIPGMECFKPTSAFLIEPLQRPVLCQEISQPVYWGLISHLTRANNHPFLRGRVGSLPR